MCKKKVPQGMKIYLGVDHGGFPLKQEIRAWLEVEEYEVEDLGAHDFEPADDYPDFGFAVAEAVTNDAKNDLDSIGILICKSGGGVTIAANKVLSARAVHAYDVQSAIHAKEHNNANIVALGADFHGGSIEEIKRIVEAFLRTDFKAEERHVRRINKIKTYEEESK